MSIRRLPRQMGIWLTCNGVDGTKKCPEKLFTANILASVNRTWATRGGWGRGRLKSTKIRKGTKRDDFCPRHLKPDHELAAKEKTAAEAEKKRRRELKKLKLSGAPLPKKVRKKKGSTNPTPAHPELAGGRAPDSPSADPAAAATQ